MEPILLPGTIPGLYQPGGLWRLTRQEYAVGTSLHPGEGVMVPPSSMVPDESEDGEDKVGEAGGRELPFIAYDPWQGPILTRLPPESVALDLCSPTSRFHAICWLVSKHFPAEPCPVNGSFIREGNGWALHAGGRQLPERWTDTDLGFDFDRDLTPENVQRLLCGAQRMDVEALRRAVLDTCERGKRT